MKDFISKNKTKLLNISFILLCICYALTYLSGVSSVNAFMTASSAVLLFASVLAAVL